MDPEKIGNLIKEIRKKNNLTQKQFADKYGVTYQAVSKWENGLNLPDISLLKQICKDYNISLDNLLNVKKRNILIFLVPIIIIIICTIFLIFNNRSFNFKTISSTCKDFNISGCIAYNKKKSSISISKIDYCGNHKEKYKSIDCSLYQTNGNTINKISSCQKKNNITLEEYLKDIELTKDNYNKITNDNLYLEINLKDQNNKTFSHKIPLKLNSCIKN